MRFKDFADWIESIGQTRRLLIAITIVFFGSWLGVLIGLMLALVMR
jgi:hypothetical protein